jgi:hypothetical protein
VRLYFRDINNQTQGFGTISQLSTPTSALFLSRLHVILGKHLNVTRRRLSSRNDIRVVNRGPVTHTHTHEAYLVLQPSVDAQQHQHDESLDPVSGEYRYGCV